MKQLPLPLTPKPIADAMRLVRIAPPGRKLEMRRALKLAVMRELQREMGK